MLAPKGIDLGAADRGERNSMDKRWVGPYRCE
jgi:hypothetical protein